MLFDCVTQHCPQFLIFLSIFAKRQQSVKHHSVRPETIDWSKLTWHPSTFHDDYCEPESIQWETDDGQNGDDVPLDNLRNQGLLFIPKRAIKIKGRWEWLGVEVIGPLPITQRGRRFVLSVVDFYSRWVEVYPMETCSSEEIAQNVYDVVSRIGYPYGFLSRMSPRCIKEVNSALCKLVGLEASYIVHHPQTGSLDQTTKTLIDKMVFDLTREHRDGWDVHLPAAGYRLCCSVNPSTRQRPLSLHHSKGATPFVMKPRLLMVEDGGDISKYTFVLLEPQAPPRPAVEVQCEECLNWSQITQPADIQEYDSLRLTDEEHSYICPCCRVLLEERDRAMKNGLTENSGAVAEGAQQGTSEKSRESSVVEVGVLVKQEEQQESGGRLERSRRPERGRPQWWESFVETDAPLQRGGQKGGRVKRKRRKGRPRQTKSLVKRDDNSKTENLIKVGVHSLENKSV
ncbi:hypothetical protein ACEWY4_003093 [Coilia grayii]|uniref:Integrase catalytic domain-containing protein n=1 Tax=Coilia grayii TaxID=363190 RepID=A0ABD1KQ90_9TELE